jgi:hypothetical protein
MRIRFSAGTAASESPLFSIFALLANHRLLGSVVSKSYERGCQEKNSPLLPCEGKLFALHPAQSRRFRCCGLAAYFLSLTRPVAGYMSSVSCPDGG